jgi:hypothetical protein
VKPTRRINILLKAGEAVTVDAMVWGDFAAHPTFSERECGEGIPATWNVSCAHTGLAIVNALPRSTAIAVAQDLGRRFSAEVWRPMAESLKSRRVDGEGGNGQYQDTFLLIQDICGSYVVETSTRRVLLRCDLLGAGEGRDGVLVWCVADTDEPIPTVKVGKKTKAGELDWRDLYLRTLVAHAPRFVDKLTPHSRKIALAVERLRAQSEAHLLKQGAADGDNP